MKPMDYGRVAQVVLLLGEINDLAGRPGQFSRHLSHKISVKEPII